MTKIPQQIIIDPSLTALNSYISAQSNKKRFIILVDNHTQQYCLPYVLEQSPALIQPDIIEIPAGEQNKNTDQLLFILSQLTQMNADKNACLINLGGGVICDIGAFAASIYKRGISYLHVPTTLLAQIDASIGGKNGIDFQGYKNLLGTIGFPELTVISKKFLDTLPQKELKSGIAEAFKHGLIADKEFWNQIRTTPLDQIDLIISRSVEIKESIVAKDPYEIGLRKILNAGHTIGHAIEAIKLQTKEPVTHGEAVAAGLLMECYISKELGYLPEAEWLEIEQTILGFFGKIEIQKIEQDALLLQMKQDKKNTQNHIHFSLIRQIGHATYNDTCSYEIILKALDYYQKK
jgi:3-dehydroquinate synthase